MTTLHQWQHAVSRFIDAAVADAAGFDPEAVSIYRGNSRGVRQAALASVYPVCGRLVGDACFDGLARHFIATEASTCSDLNLYGEGFDRFLAEVAERQPSLASIAWIADVARLEWLVHRLAYSEDDQASDSPVDGVDPSHMIPRVSRQLSLMASEWPVHLVWESQREPQAASHVDFVRGDYRLLVQRRGFDVWVGLIDRSAWQLLERCASGATLAQLADDPTLDLALMKMLVEQRWIVGYAHHRHAV